MYSKKEASLLKQEFWTVFGQYMSPILSAEGEKINWINYKTRVKDVFFRMHAGNREASIAIEIRHNDDLLRSIFFDQFMAMEKLFSSLMQEEWSWIQNAEDENGKTFSSISVSLQPINILNRNDWPELIGFFKPRIILLDRFWSEYKFVFEALQ